jgi:hypothetical protein
MDIWNFLAEWNYTMLNKPLAKKIWISQAVFLCELISQRKRFKQEEFYFTQNNMVEELWISEASQLRYTKELKEKWLINVEKKGIPAKNWYKINDEKIYNIIMWETCPINVTELEASKWRDYANNKDNNKEYINSESNLLPKQDTNITPNLTDGDLTFEKIYKLFYHKSWHKPSIDKCRKVFDSLNLDKEWYNMLVKDLNLFRIEYKYWIKDQMYRPWFEKYVGWFNAEWVNEEYRLKTIIKFHMENREDIEKMKKRYKDLCDTFWKDTVDKLVKEYGRAKNKITLNIN